MHKIIPHFAVCSTLRILSLGLMLSVQACCSAGVKKTTFFATPQGLPGGRWIMDIEFVDFAVVAAEDRAHQTNSYVLALTINSSTGFVRSHWVAEDLDRIIVFLEAAASPLAAASIRRRSDGIYWIRIPELLGRSVLLADGKKTREVEIRLDQTLTQIVPPQTLTPYDPFSTDHGEPGSASEPEQPQSSR